MAATDQPYRNQKRLNVVFAVSCVLMFLTIFWMLVDDYNREFKAVQRDFRDVEAQLSLGMMLEHMPPKEQVEAAAGKVAEARKTRDEKRDELTKEHRDVVARRDKANAEYQAVKADYD